jgi:hypothetical protein
MIFVKIVNAWFTPVNTTTSPIFWETMEFWDFVLLVISIFVLVSWILSILFVLYWSLLLVLSWWKEEKIKPAVNTIRYAVLWFILTVVSIFLFPILWRLLGIDVEKYAKPARILEKITEIWNKVFPSNWWSSEIIDSSRWDFNSSDDLPADFSDL